jgi:hypothetical protein
MIAFCITYLLYFFAVGLIQAAIIINILSYRSPISNKYINRVRLMDILCTVIAALIIVYILISHIHVICYGFVLILAIYLLYLLQDEYRCGIVTSDVYCDIINKFISIIYIL